MTIKIFVWQGSTLLPCYVKTELRSCHSCFHKLL